MNITKNKVDLIKVTEIKGLDPISIILNQINDRQGSIVITCFGQAWSAYWGGMGTNLIDFFCSSENDYLIGYLDPNLKRSIIDYEKISDEIGENIEHETLLLYQDEIIGKYGRDWSFNLPETSNYKYEYLSRICDAVKNALRELMT